MKTEHQPLLLREALCGFAALIVLFAIMVPVIRWQARNTVPTPTLEDVAKARSTLMQIGWHNGFDAGMAWQKKFTAGGFTNLSDGLSAADAARDEFVARECR